MKFFEKKNKEESIDRKNIDYTNQEKFLFGTSKTKNEEFEKNGFLVVRNIWDPKDLQEEIDYDTGHFQFNQFGKFSKTKECQVPGSRARHSYPPYKFYHSQIRKKIEKIIGNELFNTYYYDRVYYAGQELVKHMDRDVCEISATFQIGTNSKKPWTIWIKTPDIYDENKNIIKKGKEVSICLNDGDAVIYKGCERPHWREPLKSRYGRLERVIRKLQNKKDDTYHHQVFFHYVLADGKRCSFAGNG
jgi:hypothetical protein